MKQYVDEETTSAVAEVTSIELGRRGRLIYFGGRVGERTGLGGSLEVARSILSERPGNVGNRETCESETCQLGNRQWMAIASH